MRKEFNWYFSPSDEETNTIWEQGLLTVDTNVLLDLYRYHENTRNSLIASLKNFKGRLWLSNQAAEEFIRNRTKVIVSSEKTFKEANDAVEKLRKNLNSTVDQLRGNRIIPAEVADGLLKEMEPVIRNALGEIEDAKSRYPKYLQTDPILDELSSMFLDSVGEGFREDEIGKIRDEAEIRKKNDIPPGYLDQEKDGDRPYGDYFLWRQILLHAKHKDIPIIFVTSERKEDWWEKISGKTIGPRPELLREASEFCGQRILIYQTDRFLEYSTERLGDAIDDKVVEEIRAVDNLRATAVRVIEQNVKTNTEYLHEGTLVLNVQRSVRNITGMGSLKPHMYSLPNIDVALLDAPHDIPEVKIRAGTSNTYNFNLHVISDEDDKFLPIGLYTLKYTASCDHLSEDVIDESETI